MVALTQGRNDWYRIRNKAGNANAQLYIYDEIGYFGVTAADLIRDLADVEGPIDLHLNSPGGEVFDGVAIYNTLLSREVDVYIEGIAASIASVIAMAGKRIYIAKTAQIMVHNAFAMAVGDATDLRAMADKLDENTDNISNIYAERTGQPAAHWRTVMAAETWYRGQAAIDAGLATHLITNSSAVAPEMAASFNMDPVLRDSHAMAARAGDAPECGGAGVVPQDAAIHRYVSVQDTSHPPMTGKHVHNHAAFGHEDHDDGIHGHMHTHKNDATHEHVHADPDHDGDNDATKSGDTDHDYWAADSRNGAILDIFNKDKYNKADRDRMAKNGQAMPDGSYPIADEEDLDNAIKLAGNGNSSKSAIHKHIVKRAGALGKSSKIPDNWTSDGSSDSSDSKDRMDTEIYSEADAAALIASLKGF